MLHHFQIRARARSNEEFFSVDLCNICFKHPDWFVCVNFVNQRAQNQLSVILHWKFS